MPKTSKITWRNTTAELYHAGHDASSILKLTEYAKRTVYCLVAKLKKGESVERKTNYPRCDKKRTPCFLSRLKQSIEANPLFVSWLVTQMFRRTT